MRPNRKIIAARAICGLAALEPVMAEDTQALQATGSEPDSAGLAAIAAAPTWVNSSPVSLSQLRGRVVLVQS